VKEENISTIDAIQIQTMKWTKTTIKAPKTLANAPKLLQSPIFFQHFQYLL
jgi:hypothetical protein